jgi:hypothetical protein
MPSNVGLSRNDQPGQLRSLKVRNVISNDVLQTCKDWEHNLGRRYTMSSKTRILPTDSKIEKQAEEKEEVKQVKQLKATADALGRAADTAAKSQEVIKKAVDDALKP